MKYTTNLKISEYLNKNYLQNLKNASLNDLLNWWKKMTSRVEEEDEIEEYLNDIEVRVAIEKILNLIEEREKSDFLSELQKVDDEFRLKTLEVKEPFWIKDDEFTRNQWFFYRAPKYLVESEKLILKERV